MVSSVLDGCAKDYILQAKRDNVRNIRNGGGCEQAKNK